MFRRVAIVGATGAVGQDFINILQQRKLPMKDVLLLASARSAGKKIKFGGTEHTVQELTETSFKGVDLALFSAGSSISKKFGPIAAAAGAVVVDNSSCFRMDPNVPLVVPEINPQDIAKHKGIIANPNCSTIILLVPIWPIHKANKIQRVVVSTYQAVSGAGYQAMCELEQQTRDVLAGKKAEPKVLPHPTAFNLFSHNSKVTEDGFNEEEVKMVNETHKIFHDPDILVVPTCVRVPVLRAHSESINLQLTKAITEQQARDLICAGEGVKLVDDRVKNYFPMPLDASGQDDVLVGRIRMDTTIPGGRGLCMFVCGDQLRKGAALNAIQIAEKMLEMGMVKA
jgi:aspartate-semialdehyde dehydrogenase